MHDYYWPVWTRQLRNPSGKGPELVQRLGIPEHLEPAIGGGHHAFGAPRYLEGCAGMSTRCPNVSPSGSVKRVKPLDSYAARRVPPHLPRLMHAPSVLWPPSHDVKEPML